MRRRRWRYVVRGVAMALGFVAAVGNGSAQAEPVDMSAQHYSKAKRDGWQLTVSIVNERVNSVSTLATASILDKSETENVYRAIGKRYGIVARPGAMRSIRAPASPYWANSARAAARISPRSSVVLLTGES
jgi:hypothetical protein